LPSSLPNPSSCLGDAAACCRSGCAAGLLPEGDVRPFHP
jgi:hypothetical protein